MSRVTPHDMLPVLDLQGSKKREEEEREEGAKENRPGGNLPNERLPTCDRESA